MIALDSVLLRPRANESRRFRFVRPRVREPFIPMAPFYQNGLKFQCTRCGKCCTGEPGYVYVGSAESERLASHLEISVAGFYLKYVRKVPGGFSLLERRDGSCIFFDEGCLVYGSRPRQCRTYPFWEENLGSPERWELEARQCEGIASGPLHSGNRIEEMLAGTEGTGV